ncbi:MAG: pyridoxal phosphate-dependent aminotransferase [candidate division Zixibacteria bacterium]|nr:pyridoxal phosphate-dependent aminotransferase [candidate division Zixibacteria bacterium]
MKLANRMSRLGTETAFVVLAKAKQLEAQGKEIIHLEIGEPDFDTPKNIIDKAVEALNSHWTHYGPAAGLPELRQTIADEINRTRKLNMKPENVVVTPGGKPVMFFVMLALVNEGEEVIYPNPGFPIYESVINFIGAKAVPIKMREEKQFRLDVDELISLITPKTRLIIINSPQNPTGSVLTKDDLKAIADVCIKNNIYVLSDEIYSRTIYDNEFNSITANEGIIDNTIILDGYSKTYAMTGWRLGYGVMPADLAEQVAKLQTNCNSCTASFSQIAGIEAIRGDQSSANKMVVEFKKRREVIVNGLNAIDGIECQKPEGAFYVFPNITKLGFTSSELESKLLYEAGVAVLAGTSFGAFGEGYLRFSYANSIENLEKALAKVNAFVKGL